MDKPCSPARNSTPLTVLREQPQAEAIFALLIPRLKSRRISL